MTLAKFILSSMTFNLLNSKAGLKLTFALYLLVIASFQLYHYVARAYPDALKDLILNQGLGDTKIISTNHRYTQSGITEMRMSSATIIGVTAKLEDASIHAILSEVEVMSQDFAFSRAVFVIDSSAQSTFDAFSAWAQRSPTNRTILRATPPLLEPAGLFPNSENTVFPREGRIAQARNIALEEYHRGPDTDYIVNVDLDIVGWDQGGVRDSFGQSSEWDVVCANGVILFGIYRDSYALRAPGIQTNHHLAGRDCGQYNITTGEKCGDHERIVDSKRKIRSMMDGAGPSLSNSLRGSPELIKLDSCFGGLAIYKTNAIKSCRYAHRHPDTQLVDCEHVLFHQCMAEESQARIVSNRNMKVWYGHTNLASLDYGRFFRSLLSL